MTSFLTIGGVSVKMKTCDVAFLIEGVLMREFLNLYEQLPGDDVARLVTAVTGVDVPVATVRGWVRDARAKGTMPRWIVPQLSAIVRVLESEVGRAKK